MKTTDAEKGEDEGDFVADCHGHDADRAKERVLVVMAPAGHEGGEHRNRRDRHVIEDGDRDIGDDHARAERDDCENHDGRRDEDHWRDPHDGAVRDCWCQGFLLHQLDGVSNGLKETERTNTIRAVARLHAANDLAFAVNAND